MIADHTNTLKDSLHQKDLLATNKCQPKCAFLGVLGCVFVAFATTQRQLPWTDCQNARTSCCIIWTAQYGRCRSDVECLVSDAGDVEKRACDWVFRCLCAVVALVGSTGSHMVGSTGSHMKMVPQVGNLACLSVQVRTAPTTDREQRVRAAHLCPVETRQGIGHTCHHYTTTQIFTVSQISVAQEWTLNVEICDFSMHPSI